LFVSQGKDTLDLRDTALGRPRPERSGSGDAVASTPRVAVVGFGYIGSCLGAALAERGARVVALDSDASLIDDLRAGRCRTPEPGMAEALGAVARAGRVRFTTDYDALSDVDVVVITVGTPVAADGTLLTGQLAAVCRELAPRLRRGQLVILRSTVAPGVTRTLVVPLLQESGLVEGEGFGVAYCPERLAEGDALAQVRELPVVVGGCSAESGAAAADFWRRALGVEVQTVASVDVAEIVKLATNWWIDANIAIANELARFCSAYGVDVLDVVAAANSLPKGSGNVNVLLPSVGVGGACLTKDPWMTWQAAQRRGVQLRTIETARRVNDDMPGFACRLIGDGLAKLGKDLDGARVAVLGVAFKNDTGDLRRTPVQGVVDGLRAGGAEVRLFDPMADASAIREVFRCWPAAGLAEAVDGADAVAVLAGHRDFHAIDLDWLRDAVAMPCLMFDGRMYWPADTVRRIRRLGFGFCGIGR
jgi:UDP-N-acetyl-D-mannosaminuronic acid dehydrogenase